MTDLDKLLVLLAAVEALHQKREDGWCTTCSETDDITGGFQVWPCATVRAITEGVPGESV